MELTEEQIARQDDIDNSIYHLASQIAGVEVSWNIKNIAEVREALRQWLVVEMKYLSEQEFYPFSDE